MVDGSVKEECRQGFDQGGKGSTNAARYRYVLQLSVLGPGGTLFPLMHEEMDVHNPQTQKEDCELKSWQRLSQRLKTQFPKLPICLVGDALYACQAVVARCQQFGWKYILTRMALSLGIGFSGVSFPIAIAVGNFPKLTAGFIEQGKGFRSAFNGARFHAIGAVGHLVASDNLQ